MSETENKLEALEAKVKKLVDSHKLLTDENTKLKKELKEIKDGEKEGLANLAYKKMKTPGRPLVNKIGSLNIFEVDFSDRKKLKKTIDEIIVEIDKSINKFED